jgi:S-disulfanyl-L-cysteine oxidoreductase SoxD
MCSWRDGAATLHLPANGAGPAGSRSAAASVGNPLAARLLVASLLMAAAPVGAARPAADDAAARYPGIGRPATAAEIAAWNIDVRPDFQGLPAGSGSVSQGQDVWEAHCASCHGVFGESRQVFAPLVGGTTVDDVKTGRVARLLDRAYPERSMMMKLATVSTLWDFIHRAMPWNAPKSLAVDEVYAVTAYILNLAYVVPDDFTLSDRNIAEVQQRLPNRHGMTTRHGLWPGPEFGNQRPDVQGSACMKHCGAEPTVVSQIPDFARDAHGNLAEQNRLVGAQRGIDTRRPAGVSPAAPPASAPALPPASPPAAPSVDRALSPQSASPPEKPALSDRLVAAAALLKRHGCVACHAVDDAVVGPAFRDIAGRHGARADALGYLSGKIRAGGSGVWGAVPMPPQALPEADAAAIAQWLMDGAMK